MKNQTSSQPDPKPPIPWLRGTVLQPRSQPCQTWQMPDGSTPILGVRYVVTNADRWRCRMRFWRFRLPLLITCILTFAIIIFVPIAILTSNYWIRATDASFLVGIVCLYAISVAITSLLFLLGESLSIANEILKAASHTKILTNMLFTSYGIVEISPHRTTATPWRGIVAVCESRGDIYLVGREWMMLKTYHFYLSRAAFEDIAAAKRFHAAMTALWKAHGQADALAPEILTEFTPPTDDDSR